MKMLLEGDEWYPVFHLEEYTERTPWMNDKGYVRKVVEVDDELYSRVDKAMQEFKAIQDILEELNSKTEWTES